MAAYPSTHATDTVEFIDANVNVSYELSAYITSFFLSFHFISLSGADVHC